MTDAAASEPQHGPKQIRRLTESLVNRIAAGEIIHRPSSALKELLENCLDAGSTSIRITVKDGGLKLLQIQDNGSGIRKADLSILAERFTTSKLSTFEDLQRIRTYGFRGEALASISHVAQLSVTTKTKEEGCAWKAHYLDGQLAPTKPGQSAEPKATAGNDGTTITVENLFYNTPTRLAALRSSSEEYSRILDVVTKYAVHNPAVSFSCKKVGSASPDISTPSNSTVKQSIRLLYGNTIARELVSISIAPSQDENTLDDGADVVMATEEDSWSAEAHFTNVNYQAKKTVFLLFINHRLVESSRMKRALESVFTVILPRGAFPFIYLSLEIDPQAVDVNVHPTKREVHFLDEELITSAICDKIQALLAAQGNSRVFEYQTQTLLTGGILEPSSTQRKGKGKEVVSATSSHSQGDEGEDSQHAEEKETQEESQNRKKPVYSKDKVRVSQANRTLDSMFPVARPSSANSTSTQAATQADPINVDDEESGETDKYRKGVNVNPEQQASIDGNRVKYIRESQCFLKTVRELREEVLNARHGMLTEIIQNHVFVGVVDLKRSLSLIQHETKLYLVNHAALAEELFYQLGLRQFGDLARIRLNPPPDIRRLVTLAIETEQTRWRSRGLNYDSDIIIDKILAKFIDKDALLDEYFSMKILLPSPDKPSSSSPLLESIPLFLKGYTPDLTRLPLFLMRLGPQVNWSSEKECLHDFLRELAYFYAPYSLSLKSKVNENPMEENNEAEEKAGKWMIEHVLFACMRRNLVPPRTLLERDVVQVASLPDLYRVFERC